MDKNHVKVSLFTLKEKRQQTYVSGHYLLNKKYEPYVNLVIHSATLLCQVTYFPPSETLYLVRLFFFFFFVLFLVSTFPVDREFHVWQKQFSFHQPLAASGFRWKSFSVTFLSSKWVQSHSLMQQRDETLFHPLTRPKSVVHKVVLFHSSYSVSKD